MPQQQTNFFHSTAKNKGQSRGRKSLRPKGSFGGVHFKNYNPSMQRPIHANKALHLVLRSSMAKGKLSLKNRIFEKKVWEIVRKHAQKNSVKIYSYANAGNHLHVLLRVKRRDDYCRFIRSITGLIARLVSGAQRGATLGRKFWDNRPFTRIVSFAKNDFTQVKSYLLRNTLEAIGWMPYVARSKKLPLKWKTFWKSALEVP